MLECRFAEFLCQGLFLSFKAQCLPQIEAGLCLAGCHVVAQIQGYHLVCIWGSLLKFQEGRVVLKATLCAGLPLSFKAQCLPQIGAGLCLAGCHVVAKTQGYHLVCIWGNLVVPGGWGCCKV